MKERGSGGSDGLCLGLRHVFLSLVLVLCILANVVGNSLIILSVINYKRMRTFTNVLLVSLATADTLVGILVTPLALLDLLHGHAWPFGPTLCKLWATTDVLLCTASILNLCVISLDRYFAITSPLKYTSNRSWKLAAGLIFCVWSLSLVICSPPLFVPDWKDDSSGNKTGGPLVCGYTRSVSYRIYSACGSFYIPTAVMLFVYYKIFRVASTRESMMNQAVPNASQSLSTRVHRGFSIDLEGLTEEARRPTRTSISNAPTTLEENGEDNLVPLLSQMAGKRAEAADPHAALVNTARAYYSAHSQQFRGSRERIMYQKERKALKTIAVVVLGFIVCWLPFFVYYLVEVAIAAPEDSSQTLAIFGDIFLWLGYCNSFLNPLIYTLYNADFRRCFRDLLSCGPCRHKIMGSGMSKRMSVRRLHQTRLQ